MKEKMMVSYIPAYSYEDAILIHKWRNDSRTTKYWVNKRYISLDEHLTWFENILKNPDEMLFFIIISNERVGIIRLTKILELDRIFAELGIYLNPNLHGQGIGSKGLINFTEWILSYDQSIDFIMARVGRENLKSNKIFRKAGFFCLPFKINENLPKHKLAKIVAKYLIHKETPISINGHSECENTHNVLLITKENLLKR